MDSLAELKKAVMCTATDLAREKIKLIFIKSGYTVTEIDQGNRKFLHIIKQESNAQYIFYFLVKSKEEQELFAEQDAVFDLQIVSKKLKAIPVIASLTYVDSESELYFISLDDIFLMPTEDDIAYRMESRVYTKDNKSISAVKELISSIKVFISVKLTERVVSILKTTKDNQAV